MPGHSGLAQTALKPVTAVTDMMPQKAADTSLLVVATTPMLGLATAFMQGTSTANRAGLVMSVIGGAAAGAGIAAAVEYTINLNSHEAATKYNVILGNAAIGASAAGIGSVVSMVMRGQIRIL